MRQNRDKKYRPCSTGEPWLSSVADHAQRPPGLVGRLGAQFTRKIRSGRQRVPKSPAKASPSRHPAPPPIGRQALRDGLKSHARTARDAMFVAIACGDAMCHQNADGEVEVALVLRAYCSNRLYRAIQETEVLLALLDGKTDVDPESDEVTSLADPEDHL